ncbi:hypothetical protein KAW48_02560 [candidate division WOR-3 bacterium]|nr:hypothetical protein [candidate division WOR-3 bacterium]
MGQLVRTFVDGEHTAGNYTIKWNGSDKDGNIMTSGIYFMRLKVSDGVVQTRKLLLLR